MTLPRYRPTGYPYEGTNRYRESRRYSPPDQTIVDAFLTIVSKFQKKYDIALLAYCLMSSHDHLVPIDRDPEGPSKVGLFKQQVHACFALFLQHYWDLPDRVYATEVAEQLFPILDHGRLVEKIAYVETNHIAAGLVSSNDQLTSGTVSSRAMMTKPLVVKRPDTWFRKNRWPDACEIKLEVPDWYLEQEGRSRRQFLYETGREVFARAYQLNKERVAEGRKVVGIKRLLKQTPHRAQKKERNKRKVLFTGNDKTRNAIFYVSYRRFLRSYVKARERVRSGLHDTIFPFGTCKMSLSYGFRSAKPPD